MEDQIQAQTNKWQIIFKYSLIYALTSIGFSVLLYILGFAVKSNWIISCINILIVVGSLYLGIKARRDETLNGFISYGQGVGTGVLIALCAGVVVTIYQLFFSLFIDPELTKNIMDEAKRKLIEDPSSTEDQINMGMKMMNFFNSPWMMAIMGILASVFMGLIVSLILSIFTKKENPDGAYNDLVS